MKILEIARKYSKYNSFVDWFKMENDLSINKYFIPIFFDNGGHVKTGKKNEICFELEYKEIIYEFNVSDIFMTFKINNILVGDYLFLDAYKYKSISTRDIYFMINIIVKLVIDNEKDFRHAGIMKFPDYHGWSNMEKLVDIGVFWSC